MLLFKKVKTQHPLFFLSKQAKFKRSRKIVSQKCILCEGTQITHLLTESRFFRLCQHGYKGDLGKIWLLVIIGVILNMSWWSNGTVWSSWPGATCFSLWRKEGKAWNQLFSLFFAKTVTMSYWEMSNIWLDEFHPLPYVTAEEVNSHGSNILYKQSMASGILKEKLPKEKETKSCPKRYNTPLSEYLSIYFYWDT